LKALGGYRRDHLDNHNPLIVRFRVSCDGERSIVFYIGTFVSGKEHYFLIKKAKADPSRASEIATLESFLPSLGFCFDYKLTGFLGDDKLELPRALLKQML
jgi:hypothetical protein